MARKNAATSVVKAPARTRLRMKALERTSPERAAELAEQQWFVVPTVPFERKLVRYTPLGGRPFFLMSGPSEVAGFSFGPSDGPLALLVHGWGGYWQLLQAHIAALVQAGYHVVAFDAPGHGRSTYGNLGAGQASLAEMVQAVRAVVAEMGQPELVVAHGRGAMAAIRALETPARDYVFLAPYVRLGSGIDWFEDVMDMGPRTREVFTRRLRERIGSELADFDLTREVPGTDAEGRQPRLLAIHDEDDPETPAEDTAQLVEAWPGAELVRTRGLGHRQLVWHDEVVRKVGDFVAPGDGQDATVTPLRGL